MNDDDKPKEQLVAELQELRRLKEFHESIVNRMAEGVAVEDEQGHFTFINPAAAQLLGYDRDQLIGQHWTTIMPSDQWPVIEAANQRRRRNQADRYELDLLRRDNVRVHVLVAGSPLHDVVTGRVSGTLAVFTDISERQQAEQALRASEDKYRSVFDTAGDALLILDQATGAILDVNRAACELYGYTREELLTLKHTDVSAEPERTATALKTGLTRVPIRYHCRKDGTVFPVEITVSYYQQGGRQLSTAVIRDITERVQADAALRESEERYHQLVELSPVGIVVHCEGRLVFINRAGARMAGAAAPADLIGRPLLDFVHPDSRALVVERARRTTERGESMPLVEEKFLRLDGSSFEAEAATIPFTYRGQPAVQVIVLDITDRKRAEEALTESEEKYRAVFEAESDAIFLVDQATARIVDANQSAARLYGYSRDELLQLTAVDISAEPEETWRDTRQPIAHVPLRYHRRRDGAVFPVEINANQLTMRGRAMMLLATRDITDRQRSEDALKQRNRELALINRAAQVLASTLNLNEVLTLVLEEVRHMLDVSASSIWLIDPATQELVCREATGAHREVVRGWRVPIGTGIVGWTAQHATSVIVYDSQTDERYYIEVDRMTGFSLRSLASVPLRVQQTVIGVIQVVDEQPNRFDASTIRLIELLANAASIAVENARLYEQVQQHAAEMELRVAERTRELQRERNRLQAIFDSAGEGIQFVAPDYTIQYCNPATERITGYSAPEIIGQTIGLWQHGFTAPSISEDMRRTIGSGDMWQGEVISRRKDGTPYDVALTINPLRDVDDQISGYVAIQRDITRLKELDRLKTQFVSRIGHELRTPLSNLIIYLDLLEHGKADKRDQYMQTLRREADRLRRLVEGFLEIAELDAGIVPIELAPININHVVMEALAKQWPLAVERHLTVEPDLDTTVPTVQTDADLVKEVLMRVCDNALNYTPSEGSVTITTGTHSLDDRTWITLSVADTGLGILPDELPHLFERFYRGSATHTYAVPGVGLGLPICKAIIDKLAGRITVESQPGHGTTVAIWLPLQGAALSTPRKS